MDIVTIAGRDVGAGQPPLFLPDIGTFFNRDTTLAKEMIVRLKQGGAEIVKGEILHDANVCLDDDTEEFYYSNGQGKMVAERYRALIERKVLSLNAYEDILSECTRQGLPFVVSVYDIKGANFAYEMGAEALKIASSNIVHEVLIRHLAKLGRPMIIDTGYSTMDEIARGVGWARQSGAKDIIVEYSPPAPPAPVSKQNIRVMQTLQNIFNCPAGLSDHHHGPEMLYAATGLGAAVVEKGICHDKNLDDQDVSHALPISQFDEINRTCRTIFEGMGCSTFPSKVRQKKSRMCITTGVQDCQKGTVLDKNTVGFAWPVKGISVEYWSLIEGWRLRHSLPKGVPVTWADIEP